MKTSFIAASLLALSGNALASTESWEGFYIGGNLGYGAGDIKDQSNPDAAEQSMDGMTGGIQAGHNWQFENNIVLGVEAGLSFNDINESWHDQENNQFSPYYGKDGIKQSGSFNIKLGYAIDNFLPYVTTGITVAKMEHSLGCDKSSVPTTTGCNSNFNTSTSDIGAGANIGAGVMYKFNKNFSGGIEYLYTDLGTSSVSLNDPNYPSASERNMDTSFSTITAKINYHF
ncbi:outer membrane protein [Aeromonas lusitana]|uniref:Outer membrane protein beta-barrel domain-containing protein n=1 Tax=Aeromonas lusitana TaxID=931529 RepID=A0A2M8HDX6_9GAMM|nr:outer membrane beta-barrel protein [Aeromonas lusitana]PJC94769.1 hypothetical protein CUC44_02160 [Aeromonas lusitana]